MKKMLFRLFRVFERPFIQRLCLIACVAIIYIPTLPYAFVSDDTHIGSTCREMTLHSVFNTSTGFHLSTLLQYMLYHSIGLAPWWYRAVNILAHIGSVLLVYAIVTVLQREKSHSHTISVPFFSALLFAVHPLVIESVVWVSGGVYALYSMFFLLSFWLYVKKSSRIALFVSYGAFLLSLLWSEKAIVLPILFIVYEYSFGSIKTQWKKIVPYIVIGLCFLCFYLGKMPQRLDSVSMHTSSSVTGMLYNPLIQLPLALASYIQLFVWPDKLTLYHSEYTLTNIMIWVRGLLFIGGVCSALWMAKYRKPWFFWACVFLIPLLPVLSPFRIAWVVAERYAYLSTIGITVLVISLFDTLLHSKYLTKIYGIVLVCSVLGLLSRSIIRTHDWYNEDTLWIATSTTSPSCPYTWNNMGDVYSRHKDFPRALASFQRAIQLDPTYAEAYHNSGETYLYLGNMDQALRMYEKAVGYNPTLWQSWYAIAVVHIKQKNYEKGLEALNEALRINPTHAVLLQNKHMLLDIIETSSKIPQ